MFLVSPLSLKSVNEARNGASAMSTIFFLVRYETIAVEKAGFRQKRGETDQAP
jgi:hypothetical protein